MKLKIKYCLDCETTKELHQVCSIDGYEYYCSNCLEDRYIKNQELTFKSYWEGE